MTRKTVFTFTLALSAALIGTMVLGTGEAMADCYWPVYRSW